MPLDVLVRVYTQKDKNGKQLYFAFSILGALPATLILGTCYIAAAYLSSHLSNQQEYSHWTKFIKEEQAQLGYTIFASSLLGLSALGVPVWAACALVHASFLAFIYYEYASNETPIWKPWTDKILSVFSSTELSTN